jgi:hypothetical protein
MTPREGRWESRAFVRDSIVRGSSSNLLSWARKMACRPLRVSRCGEEEGEGRTEDGPKSG